MKWHKELNINLNYKLLMKAVMVLITIAFWYQMFKLSDVIRNLDGQMYKLGCAALGAIFWGYVLKDCHIVRLEMEIKELRERDEEENDSRLGK